MLTVIFSCAVLIAATHSYVMQFRVFFFNFTVAKQECFFIYLGVIVSCLALKEMSIEIFILNRNNV